MFETRANTVLKMIIKLYLALSVFLILISISQAASDDDLTVAETAVAKKAITGASGMKGKTKPIDSF